MEGMFRDRRDAGRQLAAAVAKLGLADPVVLALPRGGVPVAAEVADALGAPLDLLLVRKIGVPGHDEVAAGAIVEGQESAPVFNRDVMASFGLTPERLSGAIARESETIRKRRESYLGGRPSVEVKGRDAVVVDDGIATGATMRAALAGLRRKSPATITLAVPVAPPDVGAEFAGFVDHLVCLLAPRGFHAVGAHYMDFTQTTDDEVVAALAARRKEEE